MNLKVLTKYLRSVYMECPFCKEDLIEGDLKCPHCRKRVMDFNYFENMNKMEEKYSKSTLLDLSKEN